MKTWQRLKRERLYADPWIRLVRDTIVFPKQRKGTYAVVHLKGGVGVVAVDEKKRILLVGQFRYAIGRYSWEIPKGSLPRFSFRGNPQNTAEEELLEEAGVTAKNWKKIGMVHTLIGSTNDRVYLYCAKGLRMGEAHRGETEVIRTRWVSRAEFFALVRRGQVTDATSIAAVALATERGFLR